MTNETTPPPVDTSSAETPTLPKPDRLTPQKPKVVEVKAHERVVYGTRNSKAPAITANSDLVNKPAPDASAPAKAAETPAASDKAPTEPPEAKKEEPAQEPAAELTQEEKDAKEAGQASSKLTKLIEREQKLAKDKMAWSEERNAEKALIAKDRDLVKSQVAKLEAFEKEYKTDLVGALQKHLGLTANDLYSAIIDDGRKYPDGKRPEVKTEPAVDPKLAQIMKDNEELKAAFAKQQEESANNDVSKVKREVIAPFLQANPERYKHLVAIEKENASNEVWTVVQAAYAPLIKQYGKASDIPTHLRPSFASAADQLEAFLKKEADKYSAVSGKVEPTATSSQTPGTAPASNQTAKKDRQQSPLTLSDSIRRVSKPNYVVKQRPE